MPELYPNPPTPTARAPDDETKPELRHDLPDESWRRVERFFSRRARTGRPPTDARTVLRGVLWLLATGAPWRDLWCVDTTIVRASRAAAGASRSATTAREPHDHALGRSRGGFGTKVSLVCDGRGAPLAATIHPGQQHDSRSFEEVVRAATTTARPRGLAADKAYSIAWVRAWLRRRGVVPVIPTRCDQRTDPQFDSVRYRQRNVVERLVGWLKESRRIATRYDKLATTFLAFVKLAMARRLLRTMARFSDTT